MDSNYVQVVEQGEGCKSMVAACDISEGTFLADFRGQVSEKGVHTIHVDKDVHVNCVGASRYTNHSCSPNARLIFQPRDDALADEFSRRGQRLSWYLLASRDIKKSESITIDYNWIEYTVSNSFKCGCQSINCLGMIKGFKYLSEEDKERCIHFVSPAVKIMIDSEKEP